MMSLVGVLVLFAFVLVFGAGLLAAVALLGPKPKDNETKNETYECGLPEQLTGHSKIPIKFYLTAILFILFDIEIIFMYPWAISFGDFMSSGHGLYILGAMGFFLFIFIFGLFWEIKSKALEWE
jgi:NADH-quinone oxidoreductase subunit A